MADSEALPATASEVIRDAMAAKHDQAILPGYLQVKFTKKGEATPFYAIDSCAYSDYLSHHFNVINFKGILYIYDAKKSLYRQHLNEIDTHIRDTFVEYRMADRFPVVLKDVTAHMHSMGNYPEYPFNNSPDTIPVSNGIVKINYDTGHTEILPHGQEHLFYL